MVKVCEKHEVIDGLFAGIQPTVWDIYCQKLLGGTFKFGRKLEHGKGEKHDVICMPAVVQASQTTPHQCLRVIHSTVQIWIPWAKLSITCTTFVHYQQNIGYSRVLSQAITNGQRQFIVCMHVNSMLQIFLVCHIGFVTWVVPLNHPCSIVQIHIQIHVHRCTNQLPLCLQHMHTAWSIVRCLESITLGYCNI